MTFEEQLDVYLRARFTLIVLVTTEEERALQKVKRVCEQTGRRCLTWDIADGFQALTSISGGVPQAKDPISALEHIDKTEGESVFVLKDFHESWVNPLIKRKLRNVAQRLKFTRKSIIVISPSSKIPEELKDEAVIVDFALPTVSELEEVLDSLIKTPGVKVNLTKLGREKLVQAALGLTASQAQRVFAKAIVRDGILDERDISLVTEEKKQIIRESEALEFYAVTETPDDVGGLGVLKQWLRLRERAFTREAKEYGLPAPKGIALIGIPGTGKSLTANGMTIDSWLMQEVLKRNQCSDSDDEIIVISRALLVECERLKERLSFHDRASISVMNPETGKVLSAEFTRGEFEDLLDRHEMFSQVDQTIRRALNASRERGYSEEHIKAVLMVGGCSQIPSVQKTLQRIFGRERVMLNRPLDAVARGAAAFVAGVDFYDHIQHDYAIRYINPQKGDYEYRIIVKRGTPYPTKEPVAQMIVKATYDGQTKLGIAIFEVGERWQRTGKRAMELVFDPSGAARVIQLTPDEEDRRTYFWVNEHNPTFLTADPPAKKGEPRFEIKFSIDSNKRLLITVRDLKIGRITHRDYPVIKLT